MQSKIRFGVKSSEGYTSNVWTCWIHPEKGDVYLTSDALGKILKLSDHASGRSHIGYHYEKRDELFTSETLPKDRFLLKQDDGHRAEMTYRNVATVYFPSGSLDAVEQVVPNDTNWLPEAQRGYATEVAMFRFNSSMPPHTWAGKNDGVSLVADLAMRDGGRLAVVWRHATFNMPPMTGRIGSNGLFKGRTKSDLLEANRMVICGETNTGAFAFVETPIKISREEKA